VVRILVTNDDGIESKGLYPLANMAAKYGDVTVVAPATEYSGAGASLGTLTHGDPKVRSHNIDALGDLPTWSVTGPPALCVMYAQLGAFGEEPFDLVVSGINPQMNWEMGTTVAEAVLAGMISDPAPEPVVVNLNIPNGELSDLEGWGEAVVGTEPPRRITKGTLVETDADDDGPVWRIEMDWPPAPGASQILERSGLGEGADGGAGEIEEPIRVDREDVTRRACRGPHHLVREQVRVEERGHCRVVAEGRHTADGIAGDRPDGVGIGAGARTAAGQLGQTVGIDPVAAARQRKDETVAETEDQRLHDLADLAADRLSRVGGRAGSVGILDDLECQVVDGCGVGNLLGAAREFTHPPELSRYRPTVRASGGPLRFARPSRRPVRVLRAAHPRAAAPGRVRPHGSRQRSDGRRHSPGP